MMVMMVVESICTLRTNMRASRRRCRVSSVAFTIKLSSPAMQLGTATDIVFLSSFGQKLSLRRSNWFSSTNTKRGERGNAEPCYCSAGAYTHRERFILLH